MTKKLEDILGLPDSKKIADKEQQQVKKVETAKTDNRKRMDHISRIDKISDALPGVKGLGEMSDAELNEVTTKAMTAYDELMDLGMNVESRYAGRIFEVAGTMLKTGLDSKIAKIDKKLKMVELQLKKEKIDNDKKGPGDEDVIPGEGYVVADRNSLLERLKGMNSDK